MEREQYLTVKKDIARRYDSSAEIYDNRYKNIQEKKYREILSRVDFRNTRAILDDGCGTGNFLGLVNSSNGNNSHLVGVDISSEMIKIAHEKYPEVDFIVADSDALPLRNGIFSIIVSITHLQNLPEPEITVKEINRVTSDEAEIVISILRKSWSITRLEEIALRNQFKIRDKWIADVEDIGIVCFK